MILVQQPHSQLTSNILERPEGVSKSYTSKLGIITAPWVEEEA
jgi:hypothetical protein